MFINLRVDTDDEARYDSASRIEADHRRIRALIGAGMTDYIITTAFGHSADDLKAAKSASTFQAA